MGSKNKRYFNLQHPKEQSSLIFSRIIKSYVIYYQLHKQLRVVLTILLYYCTAERSFSTFQRLKTNVKATMFRERLNDTSILHIHRDEEVDLSIVANNYINSTKIRQNTFSLI